MPEIIKEKICPVSWEKFPIYQMELDILKKASPIIDNKKYLFPEPQYSPKTRERIKLIFRNERNLYKRTCSATWDDIISIYPPEYKWDVFHFNYFFSDKWNRDKYIPSEINYNNPLKTFKSLFDSIPKRSLNITWTMENSDYCNYWLNAKDCYMCQMPYESEKCMYTDTSFKSTQDIDWYINARSEKVYESIFLWDCYNVYYSRYTDYSKESWFLFNCKNCTHCFWCTNLDWKEYCFFNKQYSKKQYFDKIWKIIWNNQQIKKYMKKFEEIINYDDLDTNFTNNENIHWWKNNWSSNNLINCSNCFWLESSINSKLSWEWSKNLSSSYACGVQLSNCYEDIGLTMWNKIAFTCLWSNINNSYYNWDIRNTNDTFMSAWLIEWNNMIFNKKYPKEKYDKKMIEIIKIMQKDWSWWNFFTTEMSPHPYNDTIANSYYPIKKIVYLDNNKNYIKEEIHDKNWEGTVYVLESEKFISKAYLDLGWEEKLKIKWRTKENNINTAKLKNCINSEDLPDNIADIWDDILNKILICKKSKRPYRITKQEFKFYKKHSIPVPRFHPEVRYKKRFKKVLEFLNS